MPRFVPSGLAATVALLATAPSRASGPTAGRKAGKPTLSGGLFTHGASDWTHHQPVRSNDVGEKSTKSSIPCWAERL
jgi:hypothetical protein